MSLNLDDTRIRVLVVDDSAFMRAALARIIGSAPDMEVVATANCASATFQKIASLDPDVVTLDLEMPGLDGLGTLRRIMTHSPRPVIMVSGTEKEANIALEALSAGAFDYVPKQLSGGSLEIAHIREELISKIRAAAQSWRTRHKAPGRKKPSNSFLSSGHNAALADPAVVAIGISTGGPKALEQILPLFPADFPIPILIVQHMPVGFTLPLARRLDSLSSITVTEAVHDELISSAHAYIAPAGLHMRVIPREIDSRPVISLDREPAKAEHTPSVDVLMNSVAQVFRNRSIGVIMTGMGSDGAAGMASIFHEGGITIGQDESSCAVYGMPRVCAHLGLLAHVLPLPDIPRQILHLTNFHKTSAV
jgi:two-component system chemotaxis response regulator CheB